MVIGDSDWTAAAGAAFDRARRHHPSVTIDKDDYFRFLGERCVGEPADFLDAIDAAELYLVAGCMAGDSRALATFERDYIARECRVGASRLQCDEAELDDIRQEVGRMLLVGSAAKLGHSSARGDLRALVRLMALRAGISMRRKTGREVLADDDFFELVDEREMPVAVVAKREHRALLSEALGHALAELEPKRRGVLKMHCLDGVGLEQLATMHRVDRSTISRWIARSREDILAATRRHLANSGAISPAQFESFVDLLRSSFNISLRRLLD